MASGGGDGAGSGIGEGDGVESFRMSFETVKLSKECAGGELEGQTEEEDGAQNCCAETWPKSFLIILRICP